ncbi:MAG: decaprenylphospho-beta-D-erythro-pentofuranosid-2-ulose 2-reductase [Acidimicrobiales bacterium]|nr:decaprenylphospho-beta-D-erythro-pentofuranosid-2-ulose 2-reductase [Acidimicrobiales bacterium]
MRNALGAIQSLLILGGSSDIGAAVAERLVPDGCQRIVLAGRHPEAMEAVAERLRAAGAEVAVTAWDAADIGGHADAVKAAWAALPASDGNGSGDIDCVLLAAGVLGDQAQLEDDPTAAAELATVNYTGPVSTLLHVTRRLEEQGHGTVVVLSSVAGERVRQSNFVYGSSKAGLDGFCQGLGDSLDGTGVNMVVVRPGFVHSSMTAGKEAPPLSTTPQAVADAVADALASGKHTVWVPGTFRWVMAAFRHLPRPLWRKLSARM